MKLGKCLSLLFLDNKTAEVRFDLTFWSRRLTIIITKIIIIIIIIFLLCILCSTSIAVKKTGGHIQLKNKTLKCCVIQLKVTSEIFF